MLDEPLAFRGTAGVVDFDKPAPWVTATVIREGLEHTLGLSMAEDREEPEAPADRPQRHAPRRLHSRTVGSPWRLEKAATVRLTRADQ